MKTWLSSTVDFFRSLPEMVHRVHAAAQVAADMMRLGSAHFGARLRNRYMFENWRRPEGCECHGCQRWHALGVHVGEETRCANAFLAWAEEIPNLVVDAGLNDLLDKYFKGSTYTAAHYCGLVDNAGWTAYAAGDTMGSHTGWTEGTPYSNANRPTITWGTVASKSVDNSASKAVFNINATLTVRGAFITTNSTKGGTTGTLYGAADFTGGNRSVISGDTLNVTTTCTAA